MRFQRMVNLHLLSVDHLNDDKESFIDFYHKRLLIADKKPNIVHQWIAALEREHKSLGVITQNIDGLHSDAGSRHVDELRHFKSLLLYQMLQ